MSRVQVVLGVLGVTLSLASCSSGGGDWDGSAGEAASRAASASAPPPSSATASGSPAPASPTGTSVHITIADGTVTPNGERVKTKLGDPVTLHIAADTSGELHVHSTPAQQVSYPRGTSTRRLTFEQPGIVDVEDHGLERVIVQLQVS